MARLMERLHVVNPYQDFPVQDYTLDLQGWNKHGHVLEHLVALVRPKLIIEVGTWKGASAITMARAGQKLGLDGLELVCIDTWLGSEEHWLQREDEAFHAALGLKHGHPTLYQQFIANVLLCGLEGIICPLPNTAMIGGNILRHWGILADMIYIDASHGYEDVLADATLYWQMVRPGGVLVGDDFHDTWPEVKQAALAFASRTGLPLQCMANKWILQKPRDDHP